MIRKKTSILAFLAILLALIAINLIKNRNTTLHNSDAKITLQDTAQIHHILFRRANDTLYLSRQSNGTWIFPDKRMVNPQYLKFCFRILSQIKVASVLPKNQWEIICDSIQQRGVEIAAYDSHQHILTNIFLYPNRQIQKTFALKKNAKQPFIVELPGYDGNFSGIFYLPRSHWYQPLIIHYTPMQIREVYVEHTVSPDKSFILRILPHQKPLLLDSEDNPQPYSNEAVKAYLSFLHNIAVERYIDNRKLYDSLQHTLPIYRIRIIDQNNNINQLVFFTIEQQRKTDKNYCYVLISNGLVGILPYYRLDPITRSIDFFTSFGQ